MMGFTLDEQIQMTSVSRKTIVTKVLLRQVLVL